MPYVCMLEATWVGCSIVPYMRRPVVLVAYMYIRAGMNSVCILAHASINISEVPELQWMSLLFLHDIFENDIGDYS
jgi:hypothetical protein